MNDTKEPLLMTVPQAAEKMNLSLPTVRKLFDAGRLKGQSIRGHKRARRLITSASVAAFMAGE